MVFRIKGPLHILGMAEMAFQQTSPFPQGVQLYPDSNKGSPEGIQERFPPAALPLARRLTVSGFRGIFCPYDLTGLFIQQIQVRAGRPVHYPFPQPPQGIDQDHLSVFRIYMAGKQNAAGLGRNQILTGDGHGHFFLQKAFALHIEKRPGIKLAGDNFLIFIGDLLRRNI